MKNVFANVTFKTLRKNRTRTLVTVIGIILASAMLTAVTTFISSLQQYMVRVAVEELGNWYGASFQVPEEKLAELSGDEEVTGLTVWQDVGYAEIPGITDEEIDIYHKPYLYVAGLSEGFTDMMPIVLTEGRMPENSHEIVITDRVENWGLLDVETGDTLRLNLGKRTLEGEQLGLYNPLIYTQEEDGSRIRVVEEFVPEETREYTVTGIMEPPAFMESSSTPAFYCMSVMEEEPAGNASYTCFYRIRHSSQIYRFTQENMYGYETTYNTELLRYMGTSQNRPYMQLLYGLAAILIALIMVGGISLVYNSFAISVSDRTKQFGLLASVGATPKQLRGMVFWEALALSAVGIPLGVGAGILGIGVTLHFTGSYFIYLLSSDTVVMQLYIAWPAVLIAVLTALATVLISAWIPARRAAKLPPIEAIRQSGDVRKPRKNSFAKGRKGRISYRLFGLPVMIAGKHFSRDRKQYRTTIFSLFISIVLFISASSFSSYIKSTATEVSELPDYDVSVYLEDEAEHLAGEIAAVEGVDAALDTAWVYAKALVDPKAMTEEARGMYTPEGISSPGSEDSPYFLSEDGRAVLSVNLLVLKDADYEEWLAQQGVRQQTVNEGAPYSAAAYNQMNWYDWSEQRYRSFDVLEKEGAEIELVLTDTESWNEAISAAEEAGASGQEVREEDYQRQVRAAADFFVERGPMNLFAGDSGLNIVVPESRFRQMTGDDADAYLTRRTLYLQAKEHQAVTERIQKLADEETNTDGGYVFVNDERQSITVAKNMLLTVDIFSYGFIALISLIAAANVFNTVSTAFLLRRREFAVLSSVGMTPKEMNRMLSFECLLYGLKALLYGIPVSLLVTWEIYQVVKSSMDTSFYVPVFSIVIAVFSVFAVVFVTMLYARSRMRHENIIDSIRQESL